MVRAEGAWSRVWAACGPICFRHFLVQNLVQKRSSPGSSSTRSKCQRHGESFIIKQVSSLREAGALSGSPAPSSEHVAAGRDNTLGPKHKERRGRCAQTTDHHRAKPNRAPTKPGRRTARCRRGRTAGGRAACPRPTGGRASRARSAAVATGSFRRGVAGLGPSPSSNTGTCRSLPIGSELSTPTRG